MLTKEQIETIQARCETTMAGPWYVDDGGTYSDEGENVCVNIDDEQWVVVQTNSESTASFIAHARQDIPALLDALDRLTKAYDEAMKDCDHYKDCFEVAKRELRQCGYAEYEDGVWQRPNNFQAYAEALERAIRTNEDTLCYSCEYFSVRCGEWFLEIYDKEEYCKRGIPCVNGDNWEIGRRWFTKEEDSK